MPRLEPHVWLLPLGLWSACSLHSLDRLDRCRGEPVSSDCPSADAAGAPGNAGSMAGGAAASGGSTSGSNAGGAGIAGIAGDDAGGAGSAAGGGGAPELPDLAVLYDDRSEDDATRSKAIMAAFVIENRSNETIDVSRLTLRYYYTLEAPAGEHFLCDFVNRDAVIDDCDGISVTFGDLQGEATNYAEISFMPPKAPWQLAPRGGTSGVFQTRFYNGESFLLQNQENDYSYRPGNGDTPIEWERVTLYLDGALVWGVEPR